MFGYVPGVDQTPCAKHDLWPCADCNGDAQRLEESLRDGLGDYEPGTRIAPGVVASEFPGICGQCGQNYGRGSAIHKDDRTQRWVALACCG